MNTLAQIFIRGLDHTYIQCTGLQSKRRVVHKDGVSTLPRYGDSRPGFFYVIWFRIFTKVHWRSKITTGSKLKLFTGVRGIGPRYMKTSCVG